MVYDTWKQYLEELADPENIDVASLVQKDSLNPDFWEGQGLNPLIADRLYKIAKAFFESLRLDSNIKLKDVILTGSLASYSWSELSDIDLHILIDFEQLSDFELYQDYFRQKSINWNRTHDIRIRGYEVEVYVQDSNEAHYAKGIYSISKDKWLLTPSKYNKQIDFDSVKRKTSTLMVQIDDVYEYYADKKYSQALDMAEALMEKIKKYRRIGLEDEGVYSIENLVFKVLRRNDYLKKLSSLKILSYDKKMSINGEHS